MLGLIIFGIRDVTSERARGEFFCPRCRSPQVYVHNACRRFFTLYFIPLIPLDLIGKYVECQCCTNKYKMEVLRPALEAEGGAERNKAEFYKAMSQVLALIGLADGNADESKIVAIAGVLGKLADREVPRSEIEGELAQAKESKVDIVQHCRKMKGYLNDNGCELVVRSAIVVASVDGHLDGNERAMVLKLATALQVPHARLAALLPAISGAPSEPRAGTTPSSPS